MDNRLTTSFSTHLVINRSRVKNDGTATLYIAVKAGKEHPVKIPLPFSWPVDFYNKKEREILPRSATDDMHAHYVAMIEAEKAKFWKVARKYYHEDKPFTTVDVIRGVNVISMSAMLSEYITARSKMRVKDREIKYKTRMNHMATANKILEYYPKDVAIFSIDHTWLKQLQKKLLQELEYGGAWSHMKTVCTYVREARKRGVDVNDSFGEFTLQGCESDPTWLDRSEMDKLLEMYNNEMTEKENRDCLAGFLFACFTGLRISDLKRFDASWIQGNEIVFSPAKARITQQKPKIVRIPIIPVASQFLKKLGNRMLILRSEQKINARLKIISKIVGIEKNLTTHVARHTFGTSLAVAGVPVVVISKLMGHSKIETTMVYIHIAENIRAFEMARLQNAFSDFTVNISNHG